MGAAALGMDFSAVLMMGGAQGADLEMLSEALPDFESALIASLSGEPTQSSDEGFE